MRSVKGILLGLAVLAAVWLLLTGSLSRGELIVGAFVTALTLIVFRESAVVFAGLKIGPKSLLFLPVYLAVFIVELIKSNIDVARRVLSPSLPVNPGIVKVHTDIESDIGKLLLANSITLTPGTLTLDVVGQDLYVHWIDVKDPSSVGSDFERIGKEIVK